MKTVISALISGLLFGMGLTISGMVDPTKVLAFLDVTGQWDPTLAFVMVGALSLYLPIYYLWVKPRQNTMFGEKLQLPTNSRVDKKLLIGAGVFGVGWGLSGICPGPALVNISGGESGILLFVITMLIGMIVARKFAK